MPSTKRQRQIGKALSYLLRHGTRRHGITLDGSGTADLRIITASAPLRAHGASMEEVLQIVEADKSFERVPAPAWEPYKATPKDPVLALLPLKGLSSVSKTRTCRRWQFIG